MSKFDKAKLQQRVISAAVLIPAVVGIIYMGGIWYQAFLIIGALIGIYEWVMLSRKTRHMAVLILIGIVYVTTSAFALYFIGSVSWKQVMLFFAFVWASDIAAYVFGKMIGGPKLFPLISPNKTWAGMLGAVLGPLVVVGVGYSFYKAIQPFPLLYLALFSIGFGVLCQVGDLLISWLKRTAKEKDSGHLIPGHGGLLDRIDSLLLSSILYAFALWLVMEQAHHG